MAQITVEHDPNGIAGLAVITPALHGDDRGYFMETYNEREMKSEGIDAVFVQDNQSKSRKGVLRGLHYQLKHPQGKLVRVIEGTVYDVAVDLRKHSATYGSYYGVVLDDKAHKMFYIPQGFAHGFLVLSKTALFAYKVTDFWHPGDEGGLAWNDPDINIQWPLEQLSGDKVLLSAKDMNHPLFRTLKR